MSGQRNPGDGKTTVAGLIRYSTVQLAATSRFKNFKDRRKVRAMRILTGGRAKTKVAAHFGLTPQNVTIGELP